MTTIAHRHTLFGLVFAILGMGLGIYMASSHNHTQHVTHAHILLLGTVLSLLYATIYRLWSPQTPTRLATTQLLLHQVGTVILVGGLFALYGGLAPESVLGPLLGVGSVAVMGSTLLMLLVYVRATKSPAVRDSARGIVGTGLPTAKT
ncbi:MAG: hypothetical protein R3E68_01130 [Burkholderiaceae bacterium]